MIPASSNTSSIAFFTFPCEVARDELPTSIGNNLLTQWLVDKIAQANFGQLGRVTSVTGSSLLLKHGKQILTGSQSSIQVPAVHRVSCARGVDSASRKEFCCQGATESASAPTEVSTTTRGAACMHQCFRGNFSSSEWCLAGTFQCGDALQKVIPCAHVNDNYCDCSNGKDEPGTSACSARGSRFSCAGGPETISAAFVDDGFIDCANGSDEA